MKAKVIVVAVIVLAAGCVGDDTSDTGPSGGGSNDGGSPADGPRVLPWGLTSCDFVVWSVPTDAANVLPLLPEGFTPRGTASTPLGGPPGADAYLGFEAFVCQSGEGIDGAVADMTYGSVFTGVTPPAEYEVDGVEGQYYVKWDVLVPDGPRREALAGAGLPVFAGSASIDRDDAAGTLTATLDLEGVGAFTVTGAPASPPSEGGRFPFAEFTPADGGLAVWQGVAVDATSATGTGTWTLPAGHWAAQVLGAEGGASTLSAGSWSFTDASLTLP